MPHISVIIPSHNVPQYVGAAIESVVQQTLPPGEVLVVDDSSDQSPQIVAEYQRRYPELVKLIRHEPCNVSKARNVGIEAARGELLAFLDADDVWLSDKLQRQVAVLAAHPEACGAHCRYFDFTADLDDRGRYESKVSQDDPSVEDLLRRQHVPASVMLLRKERLGALRFDERSGHAEDSIFSADLRFSGPWRMVDAALVGKRVHGTQVTRSPWHQVWNIQTRARWCRERVGQLGAERAAALERQLWEGLIHYLEDRYWRRELEDLDALRRKVGELCPELMSRSFLARQRIYPRWVYWVRDWSRRRG